MERTAALLLLAARFLATVPAARAQTEPTSDPRLRLVAAVRQLGPVSYRDPIGVISPDGQQLAYTSGGWLRLMQVVGGTVRTLGPLAQTLRFLTWQPDSRHLAAFEASAAEGEHWWQFDVSSGERRPLWNGAFPRVVVAGDSVTVDPRDFRQLAWSRDGTRLAGIMQRPNGSLLWVGNADGSNGRLSTSEARLSFPAWAPDGKATACLVMAQGSPRVSLPCGTIGAAAAARTAYGPIAFSADGSNLYFGSPNERGTLDLWGQPTGGGAPSRLSNFSRDSYAPSVASDGKLLFGTQDYRVFVAVVPSAGGPARQVTAFQSETPSWSRDNRTLAFTYGSWRRVVDDFRYPDIAQDLGAVPAHAPGPARKPLTVIRASPSEDQGMDWSPNGRWIVLHSHAGGRDDVWIQPADGSAAAQPITSGGNETGWPRWSPDGAWIAYTSRIPHGRGLRGAVFTVGIDSGNAAVTQPARPVPLDGFDGEADQVEWSNTGDSLVFDAAEGLDTRAIYVASRRGGRPRLVHRFTSEQNFSGLGVSPDFRWVAFVAPAPDGHFQIYRVPVSGGAPVQLTFDPTDKTQPAVSRDGKSIAFTVFTYQMLFWVMEP